MPERDWEADEIAVAFNAATPIEIRKIALIALTERARLEAENARMKRMAAAWDWCERTGYFPSENRWLARPDNTDGLATCKRTWKLMDCRRFDTPLEAVEHAMTEATGAAKR